MELFEDIVDIKVAFKKYEKLFSNLKDLFIQYDEYFRELDDQILKEEILNEKIPDEEKKEIEEKIAKLEIEIQNLVDKIAKLLLRLVQLLDAEKALTEKGVFLVNRYHVSAMSEYNTIMARFKRLCRDYKEYDFSYIDFQKLEKGRQNLNVSITSYNKKWLSNEKYYLLSVSEATKKAYEEDYENSKGD